MNQQQQRYVDWLRKIEKPSTIKLTRTQAIEFIEDHFFKLMVTDLYNSKHSVTHLIATMFNAVVAHQRATFMMSKRIMNTLIENDPNTDTNCCKSTTYRDFMQKCISDGLLEVLRPHMGRRAGLYELKDDLTLEVLYRIQGRDYYNAQKVISIEFHDETNSKNGPDIFEVSKLGKEGKVKVNKVIND